MPQDSVPREAAIQVNLPVLGFSLAAPASAIPARRASRVDPMVALR